MKKWTNKEIEFLKTNYPLFGLNYCADKLNRTKRSVGEKRKKLKIPKNTLSIKEIYYEENLKPIVKQSKSYSECLNNLKINITGASVNTLKKYINLYDIDISHFKTHNRSSVKIPLNKILVENSTYTTTSNLKNRLYKEGIKERICEECGQDENWRGKKFSLILDHINGINNDNRLENLRILCPNCNATLPTHCKGNKRLHNSIENKEKDKMSKNIKNNERLKNNGLTNKEVEVFFNKRKVERPPYEQLIKDIDGCSYENVGKKYGVSCTTIKRWVKKYEKDLKIEIPHKRNSIYNYSGKYSKSNNKCECGNNKTPEAKYCKECSSIKKRKVERPSYEKLLSEINELGYTEVGKLYGVHRITILGWKNDYENK